MEADQSDQETAASEPSNVELVLPDEFVAIAQLLSMPRELEEWTAAKAFEKVLPKPKGTDVDKLTSDLEDQRNLLSLQEKKLAAVDKSATEKKIEALNEQYGEDVHHSNG